jgi:hypothetical protein
MLLGERSSVDSRSADELVKSDAEMFEASLLSPERGD